MTEYIISKYKYDGIYNKVHRITCSEIKSLCDYKIIGWYSNEIEAVEEAKRKFPNKNPNGCYYCCKKAYNN